MRANGSVHALPSKELVKEINALKAQLKKLSSAMENDANDGMNRAVGAIEAKSKEAIDSVIETAQDFIDDYSEQAKDAASALAKKSLQVRDSAADSLVETVQNRPFGTLAAVIGIGFLAGYLCRRGN
jgi:ElaB/YqjD/DUF883 family membrane-anchored ribosome-binding protein